jgi:SH3-like domain-containing protein
MKQLYAHQKLVNIILLVSLVGAGCSPSESTPDPRASTLWPVIYVASDGDDGNDCLSSDSACLTTQRAMQMASFYASVDIVYGAGTFLFPEEIGHPGFIDRNIGVFGAGVDATLLNLPDVRGYSVQMGPGTHARFNDITISVDVTVQNGTALSLINARVRDIDRYGVMNMDGGNLMIRDSEVTNNGLGGVYNRGSATIERSTILDNGGDGIMNSSGTLTIDGSNISDNNGSGITNEDFGVLHITETSIFNNHSSEPGGEPILGSGINNHGTATIERSTINNNAGNAAIANFSGAAMTLINSTISGNQIEPVGAALVNLGELDLNYTTVAMNQGIGVSATRGNLHFINSLVVGNAAGDCDLHPEIAAYLFFEGRNFDSDGSCLATSGGGETISIISDVRLGPLADNGGPTLTHALLEGSSAIDTALGDCPESDQRGNARNIGGGCDVGAYEFNYAVSNPNPSQGGQSAEQTVSAETRIPEILGSRTPTFTPTNTPPSAPRITFTANTNCRKGPGTVFEVDDLFLQGQSAEINGRSQDSPIWWRVLKATGSHCWISDSMGTVSGSTANVNVIFVPTPTPTPAAMQTIPAAPYKLVVQNHVCAGSTYTVTLAWEDRADNEAGYRVYRDLNLIATLGPDATSYTDSPPTGGPYYYLVESYNAVGASKSNSIKDDGCIF